MPLSFFRAAAAALALCAGAPLVAVTHGAARANDATPAKEIFGAATSPAGAAPRVHGGYARGCLAGALRLALNGPGLRWQKVRLNRARPYGHPDLIAFIDRLSAKAQGYGWRSVLVADMAQPRGGPMLTGHRSHQSGLDVDIWMLPGPGRELTREERDRMSSITVLGADRKSVNENWTLKHRLILRDAATDPAVARVFVNPAIKKHLCTTLNASGAPTDWLRKIRPWYGHPYHFHVRLACPDDAPGCVSQKPPPPGDGCDASLDYWLSDAVLNPPKPKPGATPRKPRQPMTLAKLPEACRALVAQ